MSAWPGELLMKRLLVNLLSKASPHSSWTSQIRAQLAGQRCLKRAVLSFDRYVRFDYQSHDSAAFICATVVQKYV